MKGTKCFTFFLSGTMPGTVLTAKAKATGGPGMLIFKELENLVGETLLTRHSTTGSWLD